MRIYYRTGLELPAGVLRTLIPDKITTGGTTATELVQLMRRFGLRPAYKRVSADAVEDHLQLATTKGIPPIVLGNWVSPVILHWVLVVGVMTTAAVVNDPWGGVRRLIPWDLFLQRYAGDCIL